MDLLCRLAGFGTSACVPEWIKFCHPHELEVLEHLLEIGRVRLGLTEGINKGEELGKSKVYNQPTLKLQWFQTPEYLPPTLGPPRQFSHSFMFCR